MKPIQDGLFTTDVVRAMKIKEAVRRLREHNRIHQSAKPRNSLIITGILESCARLLEDIDAGELRYVKHGRWSESGHCECCGIDIASRLDEWTNVQSFNFCPNCGAEMGGEEHETD